MELIPKNKFDVDTARLAVEAGYPAVSPILDELFEWLQDGNWPVAQVLAPFLASIGKGIVERIDYVFSTDDYVWQYWIIVCVIEKNQELCEHYKEMLIRLSQEPTSSEKFEDLDEAACDTLIANGFTV